MIIAVVVTYNRLTLLQRNISCLRANRPVDRILVINNGSTDGTAQWLDTQAASPSYTRTMWAAQAAFAAA